MRRRAGSRRAFAPRRCFLLAGAVLLASLVAAAASGVSGDKKKKEAASFALISGTVFRETGLSLPQAEVTVVALNGAGKAKRSKKAVVVTDSRGEFAVRVPAMPLRYTVSVRAAGYKAQQRAISVAGEERVELFFRLEPQ